jgi:HlyD family secretion protein
MNIKKIAVLVVIVALVVSIPLLNKKLGSNNDKLVLVNKMVERVIRPSILASGSLTHEEEVRLSSEVIGKVTNIFVEEGDEVEIGQLVLQVDDQNFVAAFEQSEAQVRLGSIDIERQQTRIINLEQQWERKKSLFEQEMVGDDEFEALTNQLDLARIDLKSSIERLRQADAQLEQASDKLRKTQITSPISGVVTSLDIKVGETAIASSTNIPGSSLMTIANPTSIYTEVLVDEADVATIALGQKAEIVAIAYSNTPMQGIVRFIANTAKVEQGRQGLSFTVKIKITDSNEVALRPGMSCRAEIFTGGNNAASAVPIQAILIDEDRTLGKPTHYAFINDNGVAVKVAVELGISDDEYQEITSGLSIGDDVITGPDNVLRHLVDGDAVELIDET